MPDIRKLFLLPVAAACSVGDFGYWIVRDDDNTDKTARILQTNVDEIVSLNRGMNPWSVYWGDKYTVPYMSPLSSASWRTESTTLNGSPTCQAFLEMPRPTTLVLSATPPSATSATDKDAFATRKKMDYSSQTNMGPSGSPTSSLSARGAQVGSSKVFNSEDPKGASSKGTIDAFETGAATTAVANNAEVVSGQSMTSVSVAGGKISSAQVTQSASALSSSALSSATPVPSDACKCYEQADYGLAFEGNDQFYSRGSQSTLLDKFCAGFPKMSSSTPVYSDVFHNGKTHGYLFGIVYRSATCKGQDNPASYTDSDYCKSAMRAVFDKCNYGGLGGEVLIDCFNYSYRPIQVIGIDGVSNPSSIGYGSSAISTTTSAAASMTT